MHTTRRFKQILIFFHVQPDLFNEMGLEWEPHCAFLLKEIGSCKPWDDVCEKRVVEMVFSPIPITFAASMVDKNFPDRFLDHSVKFHWKSEVNVPNHVTELC